MTNTRRTLLDLLAARPGLTQHELALRAGISTRTARRHLHALAGEGSVLCESDGPARRYRLSDQAHPASRPPMLSEGEAEALCVAALAARSLLAPTPLAEMLDTAAGRLRKAWLADVFSFEPDLEPMLWNFDGAAGGASRISEPDLFRLLLTAVRHRNPVLVDYYTAYRNALSTARRLHPLGFLVRGGTWMVVAHDPAQNVTKDFALAGFRKATRLEKDYFTVPEGFDLQTHARDRFGALAGSEVHEVRLLAEPEAAPYFDRKSYNPTQLVEERRSDGRIVVSFEVEGLEDVAAWALSWGPKLRVLEPPELVRHVADAHRAAAALYDAAPP